MAALVGSALAESASRHLAGSVARGRHRGRGKCAGRTNGGARLHTVRLPQRPRGDWSPESQERARREAVDSLRGLVFAVRVTGTGSVLAAVCGADRTPNGRKPAGTESAVVPGMRRLLLAVVLVVVTGVPLAAADTWSTAYKRGDYATAATLLQRAVFEPPERRHPIPRRVKQLALPVRRRQRCRARRGPRVRPVAGARGGDGRNAARARGGETVGGGARRALLRRARGPRNGARRCPR
jgi:hypothetical protein